MSVSTLVRRGAKFASSHFSQEPDMRVEVRVNGWLMGFLAVTSFALLIIFWLVHYTYGLVVATLAAIEDSNPDVYVRIDADIDPIEPIDPNKPDDEIEPELGAPIEPVPVKAITSKLRTTIKHLRARAGPWSRFRGLGMATVYCIAKIFLVGILPLRADYFFSQFLADLVTEVLLANLRLAWVHIVISEPSPKRFYQRIPGFKSWTRIAPIAALQTVVTGGAFYFPLALAKVSGVWDSLNSASENTPTAKTVFQLIAIIIVPTILCLLVGIPARAVFIRVAASMLPEEDESIVPFDRTFGGKVVPAILGGSGMVSIKDAWTTFDWPARIRFFKVIAKVYAMEFIIATSFVLVMVSQCYLVGYDTMHKLIATMSNNTTA